MVTPADALSQTMAELKLNETQVAATTGLSVSAVIRLRSGENNPRWATIVQIVKRYPRFGQVLGRGLVGA